MELKKELEKTINRIDTYLNNSVSVNKEERAMLLVARVNALTALQKYEVTTQRKPPERPKPANLRTLDY